MSQEKRNKSNKIAGFTLDQTILVVAVIAILATIIISSVAWSVLSRANATKITAHLTQIGESIGNYYQDNDHTWPKTAVDLKPYLGSYVTSGTGLLTPFGTKAKPAILAIEDSSKEIGRSLSDGKVCSGNIDCYVVLTISNMPEEDIKESNTSIDGNDETNASTSGRLRWTKSGNLVNVTYYSVRRL